MSDSTPFERIQHLKDEINAWNRAYFNDNKTLFPEGVRDQLKKELIELEQKHPHLITPDSPTQRVGAPLGGKLPKVPHRSKRYSLSDVFEAQELREFDERVKRFLRVEQLNYSCELKIDGINITLWYEQGKLIRALTRGDGNVGEDVTHSIKTCKNIPLVLPQPLDLEVSGECFIAHKDFQNINKNLEEPFANARNLTAGTVRQLDPKIAHNRNIRIFLYESYNDLNVSNQKELFDLFEELELPHEKEYEVFSDIEDVLAFCQKWSEKKNREKVWYDIDGIVIKVHDFEYRKRLGYTAKTAKYAIAWKFPAEEKHTTLLYVDFQVGRTGAVTPVGILDPILLAGSTVSRATLHNREEMERKNIKIGDQVIVRKAGDIIPEIIGALEHLRDGTQQDITFPTLCPECQTPLDTTEIVARCENPDCPAKHRESLIYFAKTLDIDGLGVKTIEALLERKLVKTPPDFWKLDHMDLAMIPGFKHRKVYNLLDSLQSRKKIELSTIFTGLGIRNIGKENAALLADFLRNQHGDFLIVDLPSHLENISREELENIDGIGTTVAQSFYDFIHTSTTKKLWQDFISQGIEILWPAPLDQTLPFIGKKFLITGSFASISRDELKKIITHQGGKVLSAISQNVDILIAGEKPGSKLKKAEDLGIEIWNEEKSLEEFKIPSLKAPSEKTPTLFE